MRNRYEWDGETIHCNGRSEPCGQAQLLAHKFEQVTDRAHPFEPGSIQTDVEALFTAHHHFNYV